MNAIELKAELVTREKKDGSGTYDVVVLKLSEKSEKLIFLKPAEMELLKLSSENNKKNKMPF